MARRIKLLSGLSTLALTGAFALSACGGEGEGEGAKGDGGAAAIASSEGEGAEGEGGEGENGSTAGDPATDDIEYLKRLMLVRGHLVAFIELTRIGAHEDAAPHAKHPESELYAGLVPAFKARGKDGFADALAALSEAAASGGDVEAAYDAARIAIRASAPATSMKNEFLAIAGVVRVAGDEFAVAVGDDGSIVNAHEYQDAYGFIIAAGEILASLPTDDPAVAEAVGIAKQQLNGLSAAFPGWLAKRSEAKASLLYGAAARIEIAALGLS